MPNVFDQFDTAPAAGNPFDKFSSLPTSEPETSIGSALWEGLKHGAGNIGVGALRIGSHATGIGTESLDRAAAEREQRFLSEPTTRQHPTATAIGEVGAEMGATAPLAAARTGAGLGAALWQSLMAGGAPAALGGAASAPSERFGGTVLRDLGLGTLFGLGGRGAETMLRTPGLAGSIMRDTRGSGEIPGGGRTEPLPPEIPTIPTGHQPPIPPGAGGLPPMQPAAPSPGGIARPGPVLPPQIDTGPQPPPPPAGAIPQTGAGTSTGVAGGGRSEGSIADAIASGNPGPMDRLIADRFRNIIKPGRKDKNAPQLDASDQRILTSIDKIIDSRSTLQLTDRGGNLMPPGAGLPRSVRNFSEGLDQVKRDLFSTYDEMARSAGVSGARVPTAPVVDKLREVAASKDVADVLPAIAAEADRLATQLGTRGFYTPLEAQTVLHTMNTKLSSYYNAGHPDATALGKVLAPAADVLRKELDKAVSSFTGPGYRDLRNQYGAITSIEDSVAKAAQREINRKSPGLLSELGDLAASSMFLHGVVTLNPSAIASAAGIKASRAIQKYLNDPNRAVEQLFRMRLNARFPQPPGFAREAAASATRALTPGIAATIANRFSDSSPPALRKVGDTGPLGGTVTSSTRIEPKPRPEPRRRRDIPAEDYIEPPP